jgi:HD superfamily phosphodiesterase
MLSSLSDASVSRVRAFAEKTTVGREESHGFAHLEQVEQLALRIVAELPEAAPHRAMIQICALLHDVPDHKYDRDGTLRADVLAFLRGDGELQRVAEHVMWVVDNVSYSRENKQGGANLAVHAGDAVGLVRNVVSDADKILALGRVGAERCRQYAHECHPGAAEAALDAHVVEHAHEKLLRLLPEFIRTEPGKRLAQPEHDFIADHVAQLEARLTPS